MLGTAVNTLPPGHSTCLGSIGALGVTWARVQHEKIGDIMKKALMLSAMVVLAGATAAHAKKTPKSYTFGTAGGGSYCDGITDITTSGANLAAHHQYSGCGYPATSYLGGVESKISSLGSGVWYSLANSDADVFETEAIVETYIVNLKGLEFDAYYESAYYEIPFNQYISGGALIPGYDARVGKKLGSTKQVALKAAGLIK